MANLLLQLRLLVLANNPLSHSYLDNILAL